MDPIESITPAKDSSLAVLLEAQRRGYEIHYLRQNDLSLGQDAARGRSRKDPPFDAEYMWTTYILERAEAAGALVVNRPQALRDMNEKLSPMWFPDVAPISLVTRSMARIKRFAEEHGTVVVKPLDLMCGQSVFVIPPGDGNANVIIETLTARGTRFALAQVYVPAISDGDKRILLIDGEPVPHALARIPPSGDHRGNLAVGAVGVGRDLTDRDREICARVRPVLRERGVLFCGIDVIGDYLTEINVTCPTGIRELDRIFDLNIAGTLFDAIDQRLD
jgi:glutathione synthase